VADDKRLGKNIENLHLLNKETILLGDINIDFLCTMKLQKTSTHKIAAKFEYVTTCNGNYPTIVQNLP